MLVGYDDRTRQESNCALIKDDEVFCYGGHARKDGHLNEFINNTDGYIPNSLYHIENVSYKTDSIGRVCRTYERHTTKRATDRDDVRGNLSKIAKSKGGMNGAVGGHIVAHNIDGPMEAINICLWIILLTIKVIGKQWRICLKKSIKQIEILMSDE